MFHRDRIKNERFIAEFLICHHSYFLQHECKIIFHCQHKIFFFFFDIFMKAESKFKFQKFQKKFNNHSFKVKSKP